MFSLSLLFFFFFNDTATTEIYTLSLHDALPISSGPRPPRARSKPSRSSGRRRSRRRRCGCAPRDRKSTRLNSSHSQISYAVFCLKKKKKKVINYNRKQYYEQQRHTSREETETVA